MYTTLLDDDLQLDHRPCVTGENLWLSERARERARAVRLCQGCPALSKCERATRQIKPNFGVWAGKDCTVVR